MVLKRCDDFGSRFIYIGIWMKAVSEKGGIKRAVVFHQGGLDMYLQFHCETQFVLLHVLLVRTSVYCFFFWFWGNTMLSIEKHPKWWILKLTWEEEIGCLLLSTQISWMLECEVNIEQKCMLCMYIYMLLVLKKLLRNICCYVAFCDNHLYVIHCTLKISCFRSILTNLNLLTIIR